MEPLAACAKAQMTSRAKMIRGALLVYVIVVGLINEAHIAIADPGFQNVLRADTELRGYAVFGFSGPLKNVFVLDQNKTADTRTVSDDVGDLRIRNRNVPCASGAYHAITI